MEYRALFCVALVLIAADFGQTVIVRLEEKELQKLNDNEVITLEDPSKGEKSALILSYDLSMMPQFPSRIYYGKDVTLSAPEGYGLFVAFKKLKFRPSDTLILSEPGTGNKKTYKDIVEGDNLKKADFYAPTGKIQVSFKTVDGDLSTNLGGFELTCTVQGSENKPDTCKSNFWFCKDNKRCIARELRCNQFVYDIYQHCGDGSDHSDEACNFVDDIKDKIDDIKDRIDDITISPEDQELIDKATTAVGTIVGIVFGVIIALIVLGGLIAFLIFRRSSQRSRTQGYVR